MIARRPAKAKAYCSTFLSNSMQESIPKDPLLVWIHHTEGTPPNLQAGHIQAPCILHLTMIANGPFS